MSDKQNTPPQLPVPYTAEEVAAHLRCRVQRVRELIHQGLLRALRHGREYLIYPDALSDFSEQHAAAGPDTRFGNHFRNPPTPREHADAEQAMATPASEKRG